MKLVSYLQKGEDRLGLLHEDKIYPIEKLDAELPSNMQDFLWNWKDTAPAGQQLAESIKQGKTDESIALDYEKAELLAPVPYPTSLRDAYAFRQHVETARQNRGVEMIPEFDQFPVFYFTNHNAVFGPGDIYCMPDHFKKLDYELEVAVVIGKMGTNIPADEADDYIAGYMIMNDLSARQLQKEEMKLNLGPAKGKDFANILGPVMVTPDELAEHQTAPKEGHTGNNYDLKMKAWVNGEQISEGNLGSIDWTFAEIIERVSYGVMLEPGDVIGSGTVGTGCLLEVNGTRKRENPDHEPQWLQPGDVVEMEVEALGRLKNTIRQADTGYSLLALKKNKPKASKK